MSMYKLFNEDCCKELKNIPDCSIDVVISDIPYGIDFDSWDVKHDNSNSSLLKSSPAQLKSSVFKRRGKPKNGWSYEDKNRPAEFQMFCEEWFSELFRITKPCSPVILFTGRQNQHRVTIAAENSGFIFKDYIVWNKLQAPFRAQNINKVLEKQGKSVDGEFRLGSLAPVAEPILWLFKPYKIGSTITEHFIQTGLGCVETSEIKNNIIEFNSRISCKSHPTEKPVELIEILVKMFSIEGHTVLDMFMGSGTTGVACANTNRNFIGIESSEDFFKIAEARVSLSYSNKI